MSQLVLITGTGRSGTSTMSGTLHHLGLHVPGPHLGANASNPKGFFESRWAVRFHKQIVKAAGIHEFDSRPAAFERAQAVITDAHRRRLVDFLRENAGEDADDQLVVKDPRSVWTQALWREAAAEVGRETVYVSMLRHPAEVVGSRATYYANPEDEDARRRYEIFNVARWINSSVTSERETRGQVRGFVRYTDLLTDWRPVLTGLGTDLGLRYHPDPAEPGPSPVDDFIDPGLRRHRITWDDLDIPPALRDVAQGVWDVLDGLAGDPGADGDASAARLDRLGADYARVLEDASAIGHDAMEEVRTEARRAGARQAREEAAAVPGQRALADAGGRELVGALRERVLRRVGRGRG